MCEKSCALATRVNHYVDEHISAGVVKGLNARGVDVVTANHTGLLGPPNEDHLAWALANLRVIVTKDDDFLRLHSTGARHAGIVHVPQTATIGKIIQGLMLIYQVLNAEDMVGHVEFL